MDGEGVRGARALGSATRRDTIRARERALSPEVLRRVSPRGIFGYVRVVQELADNELARSAWCRRGSRFRGVSSFLFFFIRRVDTRARSAASEQATNERAKSGVYILCVCVLLLAWCTRPLCSLSSLPTSPGPFRRTTVVAVAVVTVTAVSAASVTSATSVAFAVL